MGKKKWHYRCILMAQRNGEDTMSQLQLTMIKQATQRYNHIYPCSKKTSLEECFTIFGRKCCFWFNTDDNSTHMIVAELADEE